MQVNKIVEEDGKWVVKSEDGSRTFGSYDTKEEAVKRLGQVEFFKREKNTLVNFTQQVNNADITTKVIDGDTCYVIPSATLPDDIVMNGGLYTADEIAKGYKSLEGVPAPMSHPMIDNQYVSARDMRAINKFHVGAYVENVTRKDGRVYHDTIVNERVAMQTELGKKLIDAINKKEPIHTSTGVMLNQEVLDIPLVANSGPSKGKEYKWIARNLNHDHQAILLNEKGAATPEEGVGMMVNADGDKEEFNVMFVNLDDLEVNVTEQTKTEDLSLLHKLAVRFGFKLKPQTNHKEEVDMSQKMIIAALNSAGINTEGVDESALFEKYTTMIATNAAKAVEVPASLTAEDIAKVVTETLAANKAQEEKDAKSGLVEQVIAANESYTEADKELLLNTDKRVLESMLPAKQAAPIGVFNNLNESGKAMLDTEMPE